MIIEITKRWKIDDSILDTILEDYNIFYKDKYECYDFQEFLLEELAEFYTDDVIMYGDIDSIRKKCENKGDKNVQILGNL